MYIVYIAAAIITIIGLKFLSPFLIYLILSLFLTMLVYPLVTFLEKRGIPLIVGYIFSALLVVLGFGIMFMVINSSLKEFLQNASFYQEKFLGLIGEINGFLKNYGLKIDSDILSGGEMIVLAKTFLAKAGNVLKGFLIVFIGVSFMIFEARNFNKKLSLVFANKQMFETFFKNTQKYFIIKTFTSFLTGFLVTLMLLYFKVPYAWLLGILAFIFNFIPVVGSIIAAIPGVLIAFVTYDVSVFIYVSIGYLIINNVVSNVLEPKLMGEGLGLSPAVVFFSLLLWGWVFGVVGTFLAVPLTMTLKLALMSNEKTKWLGILLSK
ncbi:AI-2E family transporter [Nautilia sp.]